MPARSIAALIASASFVAGSAASAQGAGSATTGIFLRTGFSLSVMDLSGLEFSAGRSREARRFDMPLGFSGKQLGWSREAFPGAALGVALDARWFSLRVGAELYAAPTVAVQPGRFDAGVVTVAWAALGPRYAWGAFAVHLGARFGAVVMGLRSTNARSQNVEYTAVTGTYAAEAAFQWRPARWLEFDVAVAQDFSRLGITTLTLAANFGWSRRP